MFDYNTLIWNIKSEIQNRGMKQGVVAERAGFSDQEFSNMMNNRKLIKAEYIPAIASAIGVTTNELFKPKESV